MLTLPCAVSIIVRRDDRIAVSQRIGPAMSYLGYYSCPGGSVEKGESNLDAAVRELHEETGLLLIPERFKLIGSVNCIGLKGEQYTCLGYEVHLHRGEQLVTAEPEKHGEWRWLDRWELEQLSLLPGTSYFLPSLKRNQAMNFLPERNADGTIVRGLTQRQFTFQWLTVVGGILLVTLLVSLAFKACRS